MTTGQVTGDLEAVVRVMVVGSDERQEFVDAVLDTGFTGSLTLPPSRVAALGLLWSMRQQSILADGSAID